MVRTLVATCGNCQAGDDAFGPRLGEFLRGHPIVGVEVVDLDIKPAALFDHLPGPECLILVDAVRVPGSEAGCLLQIDLGREDLPVLLNDDSMSSHGLGLADQLALARQLDVLPESAWFIGAVLDRADVESPAGPWMRDTIMMAHRRILEVVAED